MREAQYSIQILSGEDILTSFGSLHRFLTRRNTKVSSYPPEAGVVFAESVRDGLTPQFLYIYYRNQVGIFLYKIRFDSIYRDIILYMMTLHYNMGNKSSFSIKLNWQSILYIFNAE